MSTINTPRSDQAIVTIDGKPVAPTQAYFRYFFDITSFLTPVLTTPPQITTDQNNYAPQNFNSTTIFRLSSSAAKNITGLTAGTVGQELTLCNVGTFNITLKNQNASSLAANRFAIGADIVLGQDTGVKIVYDSVSLRWRATR